MQPRRPWRSSVTDALLHREGGCRQTPSRVCIAETPLDEKRLSVRSRRSRCHHGAGSSPPMLPNARVRVSLLNRRRVLTPAALQPWRDETSTDLHNESVGARILNTTRLKAEVRLLQATKKIRGGSVIMKKKKFCCYAHAVNCFAVGKKSSDKFEYQKYLFIVTGGCVARTGQNSLFGL